MFVFQKLNYNYTHVETDLDVEEMIEQFNKDLPEIVTFDTETTGLDFMIDKPFLFVLVWDGNGYTLDEKDFRYLPIFYDLMKLASYNFAHNTKYDYHMSINSGYSIPDDIKLGDGMTVARLTNFADDKSNIGLEALGTRYVDPEAKNGGKAIKEILNKLNADRLKYVKSILKSKLPKGTKMMDVIEAYRKRVQFVESEYEEWFPLIDANYSKPTYLDVYKKNINLMRFYAMDDAVILLEYLKKALPVMVSQNNGYEGIFKQESNLIRPVAAMERVGLRADVEYLLESRLRTKEYIDETYQLLWKLAGKEFSSGQHKVIMELMEEKFNIIMTGCDMQVLGQIVDKSPIPEASQIASYIVELRTLDKWQSTYIEGMLNRVQNGRIHTSVNNSGAVTGRVSCNLQQQPKEPLLTRDGVELFHPRKVFINDEGTETYYFDYSQMELRLQAHYTVEVSDGDINLCRAFVPFKCKSVFSGETYDLVKDYDDWNSGEWISENGEEWQKVDLHNVTTLMAFPELTVDHPDFSHYRRLGKVANFLKQYAGGVDAIQSQLHVSPEIAEKLNKAYYEAYPKVLDYQKDIDSKLSTYGYIENLYGRRYFIQSRMNFYKGYNYKIQGGCADILKDKQIRVYNYLIQAKVKSKVMLPVHDELMVQIYNDEKWLIPEIERIMNDNKEKLKYIPMLCDVEVTHTNWAEKVNYEI